MANEGEFPKADGDIFYASEINPFGTSGIVSFTGSRTLMQFGKQNISLSTTDTIIFSPAFSSTPRVTIGVEFTSDNPYVGGIGINNVNAGSFSIKNGNGGFPVDVDWIAIGTE